MKKAITEIQNMTESEKIMRCRERLEEYHCENQDWTAVLSDKWALVRLYERGN